MSKKVKLSRTTIATLAPPPEGKHQAFYYDAGLPGFGVYVTKSGTKSYFVQGELNHKTRRFTLGKVGEMSLEQARAAAAEMRHQIVNGIDPAAVKRVEEANRVTLAEALEAFIQHRTDMARKAMKPRTAADYRDTFRLHAGPLLKRAIVKIKRADVLKLHHSLSKEHPAQADKLARYLRAVINFARMSYLDEDENPLIPANPVDTLRHNRAWNNVPRRTRIIQTADMPAWWAAVQKLRQTSQIGDLIVLLLLTGLRISEAVGLEWRDIDFIRRTLTARETKNHEVHIIPLCDYLLNLLRERHARTPGPAVFPGSGKTGKLQRPSKGFQGITRETGVAFSPHDLRRTYATALEALGYPSSGATYKRLLNHLTGRGDVSGGYVHLDIDQLRPAVNRVADYILSRCQPAAGNVVRLRNNGNA